MMAAVAARGLGCALLGRTVLADLNLEIPAGAFVGVFGPNGAGKTTLLRCLLGFTPHHGELQLLGGSPQAARPHLGYVSQHEPEEMSDQRLSVLAFVGAACRGERWGLPFPAGAERRAARRALGAVEAEDLAERRLATLSGGQRQRVRIAQAIVNPTRLLLLDEPLASLDQGAQQSVLRLAHRLVRERGITVLMTAHGLNPLLPFMDLVLYLVGGKGVLGPVDAIVQEDVLSRLYRMPMRVTHADGHIFVHPAEGFLPELADHCRHHADPR